MYEKLFKELRNDLVSVYEELMNELIKFSKESVDMHKNGKTPTTMQMANYYKLEGETDILRALISEMTDSIRLSDMEERGLN